MPSLDSQGNALLQVLDDVLEALPSQVKAGRTKIQIAQYVHDLMEQFLNPNLALEKELEELLKEANYRKDNPTEPSPYETYSKRKDKSETAITFFNRKYKRFLDAGILYKDYLRLIDMSLLSALYKLGDMAPNLPSKSDRTSEIFEALQNGTATLRTSAEVRRAISVLQIKR